MYKETFEFGSAFIEITTSKKLSEKIQDQIFKLIQFIKYDFNHIIHQSSAYRFNEAKPDTNILVTPEFLFYLKLNLKHTFSSDLSFNPFSAKEECDLEEDLIIEESSALKQKDIFFDSKVLLQPFVVDTIFDLLKDKSYKDILVNTTNYFRCDKNKEWDVEFELEESINYNSTIKNQAIALIFNENHLTKEPKVKKFAAKSNILHDKYWIIKAGSCIECKIISTILKNFNYKNELEYFAKTNKIELTVYDEEDNRLDFLPY